MGKHSASGRRGREIKNVTKVEEGAAAIQRRPSKRRGKLEESPRLPVHDDLRKKRVMTTIAGVAILVILFSVGYVVYGYSVMRNTDFQQNTPAVNRARKALTKPKPKKPFNVLVLGSDRRPGEDAFRTDTIIVMHVNPEQKKIWMLSIPRDTKVEIPDKGTAKINAAHFYGGPEGGAELTIRTVEAFLPGVKINHYLEINFYGFQKAVDAMGGVWVNVDQPIDDWKAATGVGHKAAKIDAGYQKLDGAHALTFVRSRNFPDADFTRMKHQQEFFRALAEQSTSLANMPKLPWMVKSFAGYAVTDMSSNELLGLVLSLKGTKRQDIQAATVRGDWVSPYVITNEAEKERLLTAFLSEGDLEWKPGAGAAQAGGPGAVVPANVTVDVQNGAGIEGVAKEASTALRKAGYRVGKVGNAGQFVYDETLVVYKEDSAVAEAVASLLPHGRIVSSRGMYSFRGDILVIVGKDWQLPAGTEGSLGQ